MKLKYDSTNSTFVHYFLKSLIFITFMNAVILGGHSNSMVDATASIRRSNGGANNFYSSSSSVEEDGNGGIDGTSSKPTYEEFILEHQVSQKEAQKSFLEAMDRLLNCKFSFYSTSTYFVT